MREYIRTVLSEEHVATIGRFGWGAVSQVLAREGGLKGLKSFNWLPVVLSGEAIIFWVAGKYDSNNCRISDVGNVRHSRFMEAPDKRCYLIARPVNSPALRELRACQTVYLHVIGETGPTSPKQIFWPSSTVQICKTRVTFIYIARHIFLLLITPLPPNHLRMNIQQQILVQQRHHARNSIDILPMPHAKRDLSSDGKSKLLVCKA